MPWLIPTEKALLEMIADLISRKETYHLPVKLMLANWAAQHMTVTENSNHRPNIP